MYAELFDPTTGLTCQKASDCISGYCTDGICCQSACQGTCEECTVTNNLGTCVMVAKGKQDPVTCSAPGKVCDGAGGCVKAKGETCAQNSECLTLLCVDGRCCDAACTGLCKACAVSGSLGKCSDIPSGQTDTFPMGTCIGTKACDGNGKCKPGIGQKCTQNSDCANNTCVDGYCCKTQCSQTCMSCGVVSKVGTCSPMAIGKDTGCDGVCQPCSSGACTPLKYGTQVNTGGKTCTGTKVCDGSGDCKKAVGQGCGKSNECASDNCADGVCCSTACTDNCMSCKIAGAVGTCTPHPAKVDPDNDCIGIDPDCGGKCNGKGKCDFPGVGTSCTKTACKACDGTGRCSLTPPDDKNCGIIDCDKLDTKCRDFQDLTSARCDSLGVCKTDNDVKACTKYTDLVCGDGKKADLGLVPDKGVGADQGGGGGQKEDAGCSCEIEGSGGSGGGLTSTLVVFALCALRRRKYAARPA